MLDQIKKELIEKTQLDYKQEASRQLLYSYENMKSYEKTLEIHKKNHKELEQKIENKEPLSSNLSIPQSHRSGGITIRDDGGSGYPHEFKWIDEL